MLSDVIFINIGGGRAYTSELPIKKNEKLDLGFGAKLIVSLRSVCGPHTCEANYATAQPNDDEHYEFNWCLRSPLGSRLLMQIRIPEYMMCFRRDAKRGEGAAGIYEQTSDQEI